jgi:hypothetical protein
VLIALNEEGKRVFVLQSEKFKNKWIFDVRVRGILCGAVFEVTGTRSLKGEL